MIRLLLAFCCLLAYTSSAQTVKSRTLELTDNAKLFNKLLAGLDAQRLLRIYQADLKVVQVRRNRHQPTMRDSLLRAVTPADKVDLLKCRYNTLLLKASITSTRVSFAGLRVGATQADFCRQLHLKSGYDEYVITDGMENFLQLICTFNSGKLKRVEYRALVDMDTID